jgi:hypothetical protein
MAGKSVQCKAPYETFESLSKFILDKKFQTVKLDFLKTIIICMIERTLIWSLQPGIILLPVNPITTASKITSITDFDVMRKETQLKRGLLAALVVN